MEIWSAFLLGLAGSLHCAGMCGPLAAAVPGRGNTWRELLPGRVTYNVGRMATYCGLGGVVGVIGESAALAGVQRWVALVVGAALLIGVTLTWRAPFAFAFPRLSRLLRGCLGSAMQSPSPFRTISLGFLNGLLPCGLVYVALGASVATGSFLGSILYMAAFGAGTFPMMVAIGLGATRLQFMLRLRGQKVIPAAIALVGVLLLLRGLALGIPYLSPSAACCDCH